MGRPEPKRGLGLAPRCSESRRRKPEAVDCSGGLTVAILPKSEPLYEPAARGEGLSLGKGELENVGPPKGLGRIRPCGAM